MPIFKFSIQSVRDCVCACMYSSLLKHVLLIQTLVELVFHYYLVKILVPVSENRYKDAIEYKRFFDVF